MQFNETESNGVDKASAKESSFPLASLRQQVRVAKGR